VKRLTRRERILLLVAFVVAVGFGYWALRLRPLAKELERLDRGVATARARVENVQWPKVHGDVPALDRELGVLEEVNAAAARTLAELERRFVSVAAPEALEDLRLQMSAKASTCEVRFRENVILPRAKVREFAGPDGGEPSEAARLVRFLALGEPYELPVREVVFDADFCGLVSLLKGLNDLAGEVVVLRFEMEAKEDGVSGPTPLSVRLLLVF
jgi:hypothetical protein